MQQQQVLESIAHAPVKPCGVSASKDIIKKCKQKLRNILKTVLSSKKVEGNDHKNFQEIQKEMLTIAHELLDQADKALKDRGLELERVNKKIIAETGNYTITVHKLCTGIVLEYTPWYSKASKKELVKLTITPDLSEISVSGRKLGYLSSFRQWWQDEYSTDQAKHITKKGERDSMNCIIAVIKELQDKIRAGDQYRTEGKRHLMLAVRNLRAWIFKHLGKDILSHKLLNREMSPTQ